MSYIDRTAPSPLQVPGFPDLKGVLAFVNDSNRHNYGWDRNNFRTAVRLGIHSHAKDRDPRRIRHFLYGHHTRSGGQRSLWGPGLRACNDPGEHLSI